jgi:replicative DNA helicase
LEVDIMSLNPYDYESILIGTILRYGNEAAALVLPALTPDRFVYSRTGKLGSGEHRDIWRAIEKTFLQDKATVNVPNVLANIQDKSDDVQLYLQATAEMVQGRYHVYSVDASTLRNMAEFVDKVGAAYFLMAKARKIADSLNDQERFEREVVRINDVDAWTNNNLSEFRGIVKISTGGLQHVSIAVAEVKEEMRSKRSGEQTTYLPCGLPSLTVAGMFAAGTLEIVHGKSGGGKSAFVHQVDLGIAIGLVKNNIPGCVAVFSLEMSQKRLTKRFAALLAGVDSTFLDGKPDDDPLYDVKYRQMEQWLDYVGTLPIYIDHTNFLTTSAMQFATEGLNTSEYGPVRAFSADYIELFKDDAGENKEQKLDHIIHEHLALTRMTGAHGTIISQTTYPTGGQTIYPAGPGGTRYSQAIGQAADSVYEMWNPIAMRDSGTKYARLDGVSDQQVTFFIQKHRDGAMKSVRLNWEPTCTRFSDPLLNDDAVFSHFSNEKKTTTNRTVEEEF